MRGTISHHEDDQLFQARYVYQGRLHTKAFSFSACGGEDKAWEAADRWLREESENLPSPYSSALRSRPSPSKADKTLPPGVSLSCSTNRSGTKSYRYQVLWHDGDKPRVKSFGFGTLKSREQALSEALEFRADYVEWRKSQ